MLLANISINLYTKILHNILYFPTFFQSRSESESTFNNLLTKDLYGDDLDFVVARQHKTPHKRQQAKGSSNRMRKMVHQATPDMPETKDKFSCTPPKVCKQVYVYLKFGIC